MLLLKFYGEEMPEGKTQIYLHEGTKREIKARAALEGVTMQDYVQELVNLTKDISIKQLKEKLKAACQPPTH